MYDSCICIDDTDEASTLLSAETPRARAGRVCHECRGAIEAGTRYLREKEVSVGVVTTHDTCLTCSAIRDDLFQCGFYWRQIWTDIHEAVCDGDDCVCPDSYRARFTKEKTC